MPNITLSVPEDVIKKVRKIAIERNTTLTAMVREFLRTMAEREENERKDRAYKLEMTFKEYSLDMGQKRWTRAELYDRR
jgi:hypothetical protein